MKCFLLGVGWLCLSIGCATVRIQAPTPAPFGTQAAYSVQYFPDKQSRPQKFRVRVGLGQDGLVLLEVRGFAGPAALIGAAVDGRARIVLSNQRQVFDGADTEQFWARFTGVPVSGGLLRDLLQPDPTASANRNVAGWDVRSIEIVAADRFPRQLRLSRDTSQLELRLTELGALPKPPEWPRVPNGFELVEDTQLEAAPEVLKRDPHSSSRR